MTRSIHRTFGILSAAIVLLAIVWGFIIAGTPQSQRLLRFDERKLEHLRTIYNTVNNIVYESRAWEPSKEFGVPKALPKTLDDIAAGATYQKVTTVDPQTGETYVYRTTGKTAYELCATFNLARDQSYDVGWNHPAGLHCYQFDTLKPNR